MASISATVHWTMGGGEFLKGRYSRDHEWRFDGGTAVRASASPAVVPPPLSDPAAVDPEEALLAAIASCHMLSFLHVASRKGFAIAAYEDHATATMAKMPNGSMWVDTATLNPRITWEGAPPSADELHQLHHAAHQVCFIANSIKTEVTVNETAHAVPAAS